MNDWQKRMTSPSLFRELFAEAGKIPKDSLDGWFDRKTATFGGRDVLDTVRDLVGHAAKFDREGVAGTVRVQPAGRIWADQSCSLRLAVPKRWIL